MADMQREEFERVLLARCPTADMRRSPDNEGYINSSVSWTYWGWLRGRESRATPHTREFRYLVSWTLLGEVGHTQVVLRGEWKTVGHTLAALDAIKERGALSERPIITSVFPMGEVTP